MPASNQYMEAQPNVLKLTPAEVAAAAVHARLSRGRGTMVMLVTPQGRVRMVRDEMLEDDTGRGVVDYFTKKHTPAEIQTKLDLFLASNQEYLRQ